MREHGFTFLLTPHHHRVAMSHCSLLTGSKVDLYKYLVGSRFLSLYSFLLTVFAIATACRQLSLLILSHLLCLYRT
jgi:replication initiation and membrane attachment protein DnaB